MGSYSDFRQREAKSNDTPKKSRAQRAISSPPAIDPRYVKPSARGTLREAEHITTTSSSPAEIDRRVATRRAKKAVQAKRREKRAITRLRKQSRQNARERKAKLPKAPKKYEAPKTEKQNRVTKPPAKAVTRKPETFQGVKTAGTPTVKELKVAKARGTLKVNKKGYAVTPRVKKAAKKVKRLRKKVRKQRSRADLPYLEGEQERNARTYLRRGEKAGATRKEKLAAIETGLVESGFKNYTNQAETDADSLGVRQERTSIYGTGPQGPTNVPASADRLYQEMRTDAGTSSAATPGQLAQAAQGSAFPERYDERSDEAKAILSAHNKGKTNPKVAKRLKKAEAEAKDLGLKVDEGKPVGKPTKKVLTRFKAAKTAATELEKAKLPYVWGGGHGDPKSRPTSGGLDCSGAVGYVLNKMGAMKGSLVSGEFGSVLKPGPGAVTVFYNPTHVFMKIGNRYFGTSRSNPGGGAGFIEGTPDDLSKYSVGHVPGLGKKVAVQLGIPLTSGGQSFPGMTLSSSGTTATIQSGAGATKTKPGFSTKPITAEQKARRRLKKLESLGVGVGTLEDLQGGKSSESSGGSTLADLEAKYL